MKIMKRGRDSVAAETHKTAAKSLKVVAAGVIGVVPRIPDLSNSTTFPPSGRRKYGNFATNRYSPYARLFSIG